MISRVGSALPGVAVKAFSAIELIHMTDKAGVSYAEGLAMLKDAGMSAIPGGGAEIFDGDVRSRICPEKGGAEQWLSLHGEAHRLGIRSNATMLYGHIENIAHRIDHLQRLRDLQDATGGFDAFIPLKYRRAGNRLGEGREEVPVTEDMRTLAMSRIFLDNVPHIKAYWVMYGKAAAEMALAFGADDMDGTIDDTTKIYSMAGAEEQSPRLTTGEIERMAASAGLRAVERDTFYNEIQGGVKIGSM
jgi:aminodeoxyfutalosine synthase